MLSPNQLYDYLRYFCHSNKKSATVRSFTPNGSKLLMDLAPADTPYIEDNPLITTAHDISNENYRLHTGCMDMYDQEPVDINAFYNHTIKAMDKSAFRMGLNSTDFVFSASMGIYLPIICHSEQNSKDIQKFKDNNFIEIYFWSNAFTSRYWFNHYMPLQQPLGNKQYRFGVYIRDTTGSRVYRNDIIDFIKTNNNVDIFCPLLTDPSSIPSSTESANIDWKDSSKFNIQLVAETLFNTEKIHLTEKVFKPIVMYQPFILFAGPGSLQYLKNYGFKTFSELWNESYDNEQDTDKRFYAITKLIKHLNDLSKEEFDTLMSKATQIVEYNREYFFSDKFHNKVFNELMSNTKDALDAQEESFFEYPGGSLFHYCNMYDKETHKTKFDMYVKPGLQTALRNIGLKSETVKNKVLKKYNFM